jgi:hypothetical protein
VRGRVAVAEEEACVRGRAVVEEEEDGLSGVDSGSGDRRSSRESATGT